jgi:hypothetical protein
VGRNLFRLSKVNDCVPQNEKAGMQNMILLPPAFGVANVGLIWQKERLH